MKIVILAGGLGTRISEESYLKPKPMVEIGDMPILVHIMKIYAAQGFNDFIILAGYKQKVIKEYFANYKLYNNDVTIDLKDNTIKFLSNNDDNWHVTIVDTGLNTATGGRVKRIQKLIGNNSFMLTYGDAVANIDVNALLEEHKNSGKLGTISVYNFGQSKGVVDIGKNGEIVDFREKSDFDGDLINIGFMVMEPAVFDMIPGDESSFEETAMKELVRIGQLGAYRHMGYWQCMDTINEKKKLEKLWNSGTAPWKIWKE